MKFSIHHLTVLLIIGLTVLIIFQTNGIDKTIERNEAALIRVRENNKNLVDSIQAYKIELKKFEIRNQILQTQKDSLLYSFKRNNAKDWDDLLEIKKKQAELNSLLQNLRERNNAFN